MFEPYQTVERIVRAQAPFNQHYQETSFRWMQGVFQCDFVLAAHVDDLQSYYRKKYPENYNYNPMKTLVLPLSTSFCRYNTSDSRWTLESCPLLDRQTMEEECKNKYSYRLLIKISRMPGQNLKQLLSICETLDQFDCKFIFLARDPRGIIPSSKAVGFYEDQDRADLNGTQQFSQRICGLTEANLKIIQSLRSPEKSRFMLLRYEDLAANLLKKLAKFASVC